ncbi:MAG TPA: hypothetical protein DCM05_09735 [Elusimicrobia bacterium]|nr:hypothetical protein [Elusimicrobiota bacterium]
MKLLEIVWPQEIAEKVERKHGLSVIEVEEACADPCCHLRKAWQGRYRLLGRSQAGRYILIVFEHAGRGTIRIITARAMDERERDLYWRHAQ